MAQRDAVALDGTGLGPRRPAPPAPEYVERARELVPLIAAHADQADRERRVPAVVWDALTDAGLTRMLLPRWLDGGEIDPVTYCTVLETIARADASTAWCLSQISGCSMTSVYLEPRVAREVFGDRRAVLAWGPGPTARAVAVDGGYRVTGRWSFLSGGHHATWYGAAAPIHESDGTPRRRADGAPDVRTLLVPASVAPLEDTWQVVGLRATASDSFTLTDHFVPREYAVVRDLLSEVKDPAPLYCFPTGSVYASGFASIALGVARTTLNAFVELARDKKARGFRHALRESGVVQSHTAQAEAWIGSARAYLFGALQEIWDDVGRAGAITMEQRIRIRLAGTYATHQARAAVDALYQAAGSTAIFERGPFERRFRDIHTITQQLQGQLAHFETVGRFLLGLEPDSVFL
jgi:alkylation response protein AidB-like acyl-CoA dehydrogenase